MRKRIKEYFISLKNNCDKGFTLVELLVAIAVLSIVVFPTMEVFITATKTNSRARTELQATITADSVLESGKAFSLYTYDNQCKKTYNSTGDDFKLLAGRVVSGTEQKLTSAAYGGTVGVIEFEPDGKTIKKFSKGSGPFKEISEFTTGEKIRYAYCINGIRQSSQRFDAVIVFENTDELKNDTNIEGADITASEIANIANKNKGTYNYEFKISVYVYKHSDTPAYIGKNIYDNPQAIAVINGSKLDSALKPAN
ncbi:MAG: type II secretion system protein [Clostridiales bacterium]|nr:type II secretion system protein [Clostridiales bacterium]